MRWRDLQCMKWNIADLRLSKTVLTFPDPPGYLKFLWLLGACTASPWADTRIERNRFRQTYVAFQMSLVSGKRLTALQF